VSQRPGLQVGDNLLDVGTLSSWSARRRKPARSANPTTGTSPAADTKLGSSNTAARAENL
jgi:hypothetical protein